MIEIKAGQSIDDVVLMMLSEKNAGALFKNGVLLYSSAPTWDIPDEVFERGEGAQATYIAISFNVATEQAAQRPQLSLVATK